jgi:hypothetical protein
MNTCTSIGSNHSTAEKKKRTAKPPKIHWTGRSKNIKINGRRSHIDYNWNAINLTLRRINSKKLTKKKRIG